MNSLFLFFLVMFKYNTIGMFESIRTAAGHYLLQKHLSVFKRNKQVSNIAEAKTIALIFHLEDDIQFHSIEGLASDLRNSGKTIMIYGLYKGSDVPSYYYPSINRKIITKNEMNWYMKPASTDAIDFYGKEFDILINLSKTPWFPVCWMVALSRARMKVGRNEEGLNKYYDLMIGDSTYEDTDRWIEQIIHYLNVIKS